MAIAKNHVFHARTKHIEIQYHYVRKPNPAGKFAKWIYELQEFSFTFITESTTRASLADLLTSKEEEEETNVKEELCEELETPPTAFKLHFDGAFSPSTKCGARV